MNRPTRALLFLVRAYQSFFSGLMPSACKFYPSCSQYAADALRLHGARRGSWLALRRVLRCHPFTRGGVDLVPDAEESFPPASTPQTGRAVWERLGDLEGRSHRSENRQAEACAAREARP